MIVQLIYVQSASIENDFTYIFLNIIFSQLMLDTYISC